jgi:cell division transport system permease protein
MEPISKYWLKKNKELRPLAEKCLDHIENGGKPTDKKVAPLYKKINAGWGLTILFAIIAFLIIFNTIRVAIHTHSMEISIKRLVGANNWFIRGPYIVEAFLFTALSVAITVGAVLFALRWIDPYLTVIFANGFNLTSYYTLNLVPIFGAEALA